MEKELNELRKEIEMLHARIKKLEAQPAAQYHYHYNYVPAQPTVYPPHYTSAPTPYVPYLGTTCKGN